MSEKIYGKGHFFCFGGSDGEFVKSKVVCAKCGCVSVCVGFWCVCVFVLMCALVCCCFRVTIGVGFYF